MTQWIRYVDSGVTGFGTLEGAQIAAHSGDMFASPQPTGRTLELGSVSVSTPTSPGKSIALRNNFRALAAKLGSAVPTEPLYFIKGNNSYLLTSQTIRRPKSYAGKVVYEGELGVATGLDPTQLSVRTLRNDHERQNYPLSDMVSRPQGWSASFHRP
jgi:2-keto-4-pentenoate hydratase/2-oxohepta-3-ene-1,7-dioic acid hydratase in catechol pathway